jgi:hypothetical protein
MYIPFFMLFHLYPILKQLEIKSSEMILATVTGARRGEHQANIKEGFANHVANSWVVAARLAFVPPLDPNG